MTALQGVTELAIHLEDPQPMTTRKLIVATLALVAAGSLSGGTLLDQQAGSPAPPAATFKSSVDLVRISAVVRDKKGRFVNDLTSRDFEVLDGGIARSISEFRRDEAGVSIALLFDVSGSM